MARWGWVHYHLTLKSNEVMHQFPSGHYHLASKSNVIMLPCPPCHYRPALKGKVVMLPSPPGHYHFALKGMVVAGQKSTGIGPGITPNVAPRVTLNSSLRLNPRSPPITNFKNSVIMKSQNKVQMLQRAGGSAAIPTMRLPLNAAMHALPSPRFLQTNVVMLPWRPCHYNLFPKSKVVMLPCPPCHYHLLVNNSKVVMLPCPPCH